MQVKLALLTYLGILLSLVVGYGYLLLSPENWPEMTEAQSNAQSQLFKVVYFSCSSGVSLLGWVVVMQTTRKPLISPVNRLDGILIGVFVGYLTTQFAVDIFNSGEYQPYWQYIDHGSAIALACCTVYHAFKLMSSKIKNVQQ